MSSERANVIGRGKQVVRENDWHLGQGVADLSLGSGEWEEVGQKKKNQTGSNAAAKGAQKSNTNAWMAQKDVQKRNIWSGNGGSKIVDMFKPAGRGSSTLQPRSTPQKVISTPRQNGRNWNSKGNSNSDRYVPAAASSVDDDDESDASSGLDDYEDDDEDDIFSDDSDSSMMSQDNRKNIKLFKHFFETLDKLSVEKINDPNRQWHCPACKGGPGAIDWYQGMQPLIRHAETKGSKRVKLHRQLAQLLKAELKVRGTTAMPAGVVLGKWEGLKEDDTDHNIIWPPTVFIMNTKLDQDESSDKWLGMGTEELLLTFTSYFPSKGKHSYGPQGHRGISTLIFETSALGYIEAARLHRHFAEQGLGRDAWDHNPVLFRSGGQRQLYGFLAMKQDLEMFNRHSEEKLKLKFEIKSYKEMVLEPLRKTSNDSQQVNLMMDRVAKEEKHSQALEEALRIVNEKMLKIQEENRILRERTRLHYEQNKEEMDFQEEFYKDVLSHTQI